MFALILLAGALRRTTWLPRGSLALTATALLAFAVSNPDRRIAERNLEGPVDERVLRGLSADAAPALPCHLTLRIRRELAEPDGIAGLNLARARARDALARCRP